MRLLTGWDAIGRAIGMSRRTAQDRRDSLLDAGAIWIAECGRPRRARVFAYRCDLVRWAAQRTREEGKV